MMNLNNLIDEMFNNQITTKSTELDEGIIDAMKNGFNKVVDFFKRKYQAVSASIKKISNKFVLVLFGNNNRSIVYKGRKILDMCMEGYGGKSDNVMAISVMGNTKLSSSAVQSESLFSRLGKELNEADMSPEEYMAMKNTAVRGQEGYKLQKGEVPEMSRKDSDQMRLYNNLVGLGGQMNAAGLAIPSDETLADVIKEDNYLSADELMECIRLIGYQLKFRATESDPIPSILIFGLAGHGKTWICEAMANELKMNFKAVEVASMYKEIFGGMPGANDHYFYVDENGKKQEVSAQAIYGKDFIPSHAHAGEDDEITVAEKKSTGKTEEGGAKRGPGRPRKNPIGESISTDGLMIKKFGKKLEILGYREDIDYAKSKYGLIQKELLGTLTESEKKSSELKIQAYILRNRLSGDIVPKSITESAEYSKYAMLLEDSQVSRIEREIELKPIKGVLPPSGDTAPWLLLLDEFNRGDEQMNAVMNLMYTGSIGTIYHLPLKTIVAVAGNIGGEETEQGDGEHVQKMTAAMLSRLNMVVKYQSDANARAEFGASRQTNTSKKDYDTFENGMTNKDYEMAMKKGYTIQKYKDHSDTYDATETEQQLRDSIRMPSAWLNFTSVAQALKGSKRGDTITTDEGALLNQVRVSSFQPGVTIPLNPRFADRVAENIISASIKDWMNDDLIGNSDGKHGKDFYQASYKYEKFPYYDNKSKSWKIADNGISPINMYVQRTQLMPRNLKIINNSLMQNAGKNLQDLIGSTRETMRISKIGTVSHIVLNFDNDLKKAQSEGVEAGLEFRKICNKGQYSFIHQLPKVLEEWGSEERLTELLKNGNIEYSGSPLVHVSLNIVQYLETCGIGDDTIYGLAASLCAAVARLGASDKKEEESFILSIMVLCSKFNDVMNSQFENIGLTGFGEETHFEGSEEDANAVSGKLGFSRVGGNNSASEPTSKPTTKRKAKSLTQDNGPYDFFNLLREELEESRVINGIEDTDNADDNFDKVKDSSSSTDKVKKAFGRGVKEWCEAKLDLLYDSIYRNKVEDYIGGLVKNGIKNSVQVAIETVSWAIKNNMMSKKEVEPVKGKESDNESLKYAETGQAEKE